MRASVVRPPSGVNTRRASGPQRNCFLLPMGPATGGDQALFADAAFAETYFKALEDQKLHLEQRLTAATEQLQKHSSLPVGYELDGVRHVSAWPARHVSAWPATHHTAHTPSERTGVRGMRWAWGTCAG